MSSHLPPPFDQPDATCAAEQIFRQYAALCRTLTLDVEAGLGGKLLYAGELTSAGRDLLFAANIAGAASLAASADPTVQRMAMRDGVVDFVVTSLEEALRILKNEIRKRQTVSVGVGVAPQKLVEAMLERGVLPELLAADGQLPLMERFAADGARRIEVAETTVGDYICWSVDRQFAQWLPRLDALAIAAIPAGDTERRRWLRLAPRYLGRLAQRERGVVLSDAELEEFREAARKLAAEATDPVQIEIAGQPIL